MDYINKYEYDHIVMVAMDQGEFIVSVVNAPRDYSFRQRLKMAWAVLCGEEHHLSEIVLHRDELEDFKGFVKKL